MKQVVQKTVVFLLIMLLSIPSAARAEDMPNVSAQSACMLDMSSGKMLYGKKEHEKRPMASTTKIMTAILAIESGKMDQLVTIPASATRVEGTKIYVKTGEKLYLRDLVEGLMLNSGNDAAEAIACFLSGNMNDFAKKMTQKAQQIGAADTQFKNAHGLSQEGHYTTAYDLALITRYALQNKEFARIASMASAQISTYMDARTIYLKNHNKLLSLYDGAVGVKTGFTKEAGRCLVGAAKQNGVYVVTVTLKAPNDWQDHIAMFTYAFSHYESRMVFEKNYFLKTAAVQNGEKPYVKLVSQQSAFVTAKKQEKVASYLKYTVPSMVKAPVKKGEKIGYVDLYVDDLWQKRIPLLAKNSVSPIENKSFSHYFSLFFKNWLRQD